MSLLALESIFSGLAAHTDQGGEAIRYWQQWRLVAMSFLPGTWLLFSFSYARGNAREFLFKWRFMLAAAFVAARGHRAGFSYHDLIAIDYASIEPDLRLLHLTMAGLVLYASFLIAAVLVLMNLERTFRASVGTMRWRIKFMILGLGVLFAVRVYTSSQALLWPGRGIDESLLTLDSIGLLLGCCMVLRSLLRRPVDVAVYPPFALLQNSLIVLLAGIYLMVVGVFAKFVEWIGVDTGFQAKTFIILVALVGLTIVGLSDRVRLYARRFFSRYLQRPLYDYRTVWRSFTEATASRVKQEELCEAAAKQVAEIFPSPLRHPLAGGREKGESFLRRFDFLVARRGEGIGTAKGSRSGEEKILPFLVHQPEGDGEGLKYFRDLLGRGFTKLLLFDAGSGRFGETSPDGAIIVKRPLQITAEKTPHVQPHAVRQPHNGQADQSDQDNERLCLKTRVHPDPLDEFGKHPDDHEVNPRQKHDQ